MLSDYHLPVNIIIPGNYFIQFAEEILKLIDTTSKIVYLPLPKDDPKQRKPDITKAKNILGWEPKVDRAEGLKITLDYFRKELWK